jgi:ankyrin repeat protein
MQKLLASQRWQQGPAGSLAPDPLGSAAGMSIDEQLLQAAGRNDVPMLCRFIEQGANVNWHHPQAGWTPLHHAAELASLEVISILVEAGADIDAQSEDGLTPLALAVDSAIDSSHQTDAAIDLSTILCLLGARANPEAGASPACTALGVAQDYGAAEVAAELRRGAA